MYLIYGKRDKISNKPIGSYHDLGKYSQDLIDCIKNLKKCQTLWKKTGNLEERIKIERMRKISLESLKNCLELEVDSYMAKHLYLCIRAATNFKIF